MAVSEWETILTSPDGVIWNEVETNFTHNSNLWGITYGNGLFAAVGSNGVIITSPDGIIWTEKIFADKVDFASIAYGQRMFVAVGGTVR